MPDVTKRLIEKDPTLVLHNEGNWKAPFDPEAPGYSSFNDAGVETETAEFLYSMVRILKPKNVLETGTHIGVSAAYIAQALADNKSGFLETLEFLPEIHKQAAHRIGVLGLDKWVYCNLIDAAKFEVPAGITYKLIFLDTEPQTRFAELVKFFPSLEEGGFVFIHDLHQHMHQIENLEHGFAWPYGKLPKELVELVRSGQLRPIHFETPRGLTGFYKVAKEDYKWETS